MQGIYTYIPETNYVPREYSVAAILLLLFMVLISLFSVLNLLYFYISTFRSMCAVLNMAVFWSSLTLCLPGSLLTYFLNDFEIVPAAPIITGITFIFTFHMRPISTVRSLYLWIFSASFLITFLSYYYYYYYYYYKRDNKTKWGNIYEVHHDDNKWTPTSHWWNVRVSDCGFLNSYGAESGPPFLYQRFYSSQFFVIYWFVPSCQVDNKKGKLTELVASCVGTVLKITLLKER